MAANKVIHSYRSDTPWTKCGRFVSVEEGSQDIMASDKDHEVTCKSCKQIAMGRVCGRWVGEE